MFIVYYGFDICIVFFFFQAEDGIRDVERSRGSEMCIRDRTTRVSVQRGYGCGQGIGIDRACE